MARAQTVYGDAVIDGALTITGALTAPAGSLTNAMIAAAAGIDASKLDAHQNVPAYVAGTPTSSIILAYRVPAAGTLTEFNAGCITVPIGSATCAVDLKKNGTTVLTAPVSLDSSSVAYTSEAGALSSTAVVADDILTVVLTVTTPGSDTQATGVYAAIGIDEEYPV